jgi:hypothetical protein
MKNPFTFYDKEKIIKKNSGKTGKEHRSNFQNFPPCSMAWRKPVPIISHSLVSPCDRAWEANNRSCSVLSKAKQLLLIQAFTDAGRLLIKLCQIFNRDDSM